MSKTMKYNLRDVTTILVKRWELLFSQESINMKSYLFIKSILILCVFSNLQINGQQTIRFLVSKDVNVSLDGVNKPTFNSSTLSNFIISQNLDVKKSFPAAEGLNHPLVEKILR